MSQTLGDLLREGRLRQRLSLMECSKRTHVSLKYLEAMECNAWEQLPSESHRQGFLNLYSRFLGIPPEEWKTLYAARTAPVAPVETPAQPAASPMSSEKEPAYNANSSEPIRFAPKWHHAIGLIFLALFGLWGTYHLLSDNEVSDKALSSINRTRMEDTRLVLPRRAAEAVQRLRVRAKERVWARMQMGPTLLFEGFLPAGYVKEWTPDDAVELTVHQPVGLTIFWNDQAVPMPDVRPGQVVSMMLPDDLVRLSTNTVLTPSL